MRSSYTYTTIFHKYEPYYKYASKRTTLGYVPAGIDFTYRRKRISTIHIMQLLHAILPSRFKEVQEILPKKPTVNISHKELYQIQHALELFSQPK